MTRMPLPTAVTESGVVAVLRASDAELYEPACRALIAGGVHALELTLTTPGTLAALPRLKRELPTACIGVGTVTDAAQARGCIEAGAQYLVTPGLSEEIASIALEARVPLLMGALTPTEVIRAWQSGASAIKLFPASAVGPHYFTQLLGPLPQITIVPSGGIGAEQAQEWIAAGASAVGIGGPLLGDGCAGGDLGQLTARARSFTAVIRSERQAKRP